MTALSWARPSPAPPRPWRFPAVRRDVVGHGLGVRGCHLPGHELAGVRLVLPSGAADEPAGAWGVATLCARALRLGTASYDAAALVDATEALGARIRSEAYWDSICVTLTLPVRLLAAGLDLLAEIVLRPTFPDAAVDAVRRQRAAEAVRERAEPVTLATHVLTAEVFGAESRYGHPLTGRAGDLDRDVVAAHWARAASPYRAAVVVAGDLSEVDAPAEVERCFGDWSAPPPPRSAASAVGTGAAARVVVVDRPGAVQTTVALGHAGPPRSTPDYPALTLATGCLSSTVGGRLNRRLRDDNGWVYQAHGDVELWRRGGVYAAFFACAPEVTGRAVGVAAAEIADVCRNGVTETELAAARGYRVGVLPLDLHTPPAVARELAALVVHDLPDDDTDRLRSAWQHTTVAEVDAAAARHLRPDELAVVVVGAAERLVPELADVGLGPVTVLSL